MGVNGAHSLTYSINSISIQQLFSIALHIFTRNRNHIHRKPTIYVDTSWVLRSCHTEDRVGYLIRLSSFLVTSGFQVVIVCDGSVRHHSKRSTIKRLAESYNSKIILHRNNTFLMSLLNKKTKLIQLKRGITWSRQLKLLALKLVHYKIK
jgi:hypothetical protein